ncbi:STE20-related kinase adapter protein alpha isoform X1 [Dendroctonus ponderosae]|uniref:STE20-related kinase adapter protein alpha isoform X1 n=1 Tax=Dendroctonus ponderosae TaxID=77166 RepID=UPI002035FCFF|nr:STE20-related kinase adapter protein alpha isoform X1 [Dendroctonus ponderosae]
MINFNINFNDYKTISSLGQCFEGRATVNLAKHHPSNSLVALKKFNMDKLKEDSSLVDLEIIITKQLQHPHILPYLATFVHGPEVCVVSPLMAYGSCRDLLNNHFNEGLPEQAIVIVLRDLLDALSYVHRKGYIHRAIRASHILVSSAGRACLTGFRYACPIVINGRWQKTIHSFPSSTKANLNWLSPELLEQNLIGYNEKSDIYSVGMVICELGNGSEPFAGMSSTLMLTEKVRGCTPQLLDCSTIPRDLNGDCSSGNSAGHQRLPVQTHFFPGDCDISPKIIHRRFSEDSHQVTALCLNREPYDRPSAVQLLTHPIFKTIRKSLPLTDLLKPALPLSDRVALNSDDLEDMDSLNNFSNLDIFSCEWDF